MHEDSRVRKTLLNVRINLICYFIAIVVSFITRKVFLDQLGADFIGLTTTINSLLGFLNLAELGVGASIAFFLYKPLFEKDRDKINELISIMGYLYRLIGLFILGAGVIFSLFLPLIFKNTPFSLGLIYYCFYASLASSLIGYFINYKANTIFSSDQRQYLVTGYFQFTQFVQILLQAFLALIIRSFTLYVTIGLLFAVINSIILNLKFRKTYSWVSSNIPLGRVGIKHHPEILTYVKRVFIHQIGGFISSSVMPTIIYGFASLATVTLYSNYTLLNSKLQAFIGSAMGGSGASVGNLIAEGNIDNTYKCYKELFSIKFLFIGVMSLSLFRLNSPFICIWLGKEYVLSQTLVALICADFFLNLLRETTEEFLNGYGLKADIWVPICRVCSLAFIVLAGRFWGLEGILLVPIIFQLLFIHSWKPYYLYRSGFHRSFFDYIKLLTINLLPLIVAYLATIFITNFIRPLTVSPDNWGTFLLDAVVFFIPFAILAILLGYLCSEGVRLFAHRFFSYLKTR